MWLRGLEAGEAVCVCGRVGRFGKLRGANELSLCTQQAVLLGYGRRQKDGCLNEWY